MSVLGGTTMTETCPYCGETPCRWDDHRPPIAETCVIPHWRQPCRPRLALPGLRTCAGHRTGLARTLIALPLMHGQLAAAHTARSGAKSEVKAGGHAGLALNDRVAEVRSAIYFSLAGWAKDMADLRGWTLPADTMPAIGAYVVGQRAVNIDWWAAHPAVDELWAEIEPLHGEAFRLLHPRGIREFAVGACIEVTSCDVVTRAEQRCPGQMLATLTDAAQLMPSALWCETCGIEIEASGWITYGRRVQKAMEAMAS